MNKLSKVGSAIEKEELFAVQGEDIAMGINLSGQTHIMNLLTDLYKNPIEALIRELVSNALDAVKKAKNGEVHITTPTIMDSQFVVTDTGIGMTPDEIKSIYSLYGASTKADDFEQIGAFGLGAKAPLAYGPVFTVISIKAGVKSIFMVSKEETGNYIKLVSVTDTDEPSGTTVSVPVKREDINSFEDIANKYITTPVTGVKLYVNGEENTSDDDYYLIQDDYVLHKESNTTGRIWVKRNQVNEFLNTTGKSTYYMDRHNRFTGALLLGGWLYSTSYRQTFIVELKPGVLNFSSSRDEVTIDEKYKAFTEQVTNDLPEIKANLLKVVSNMDLKSALNIITSIGRYDSGEWYQDYKGNYVTTDGYDISGENNSDEFILGGIINNNYYSSHNYILIAKGERNGITIANLNKVLEENLAHKKFITIEEVLIYKEINSNDILLITDVNEDNYRKFKTYRKGIMETHLDKPILITNKTIDEAKDLIPEYINNAFTITLNTIDELSEQVLEARRANRSTPEELKSKENIEVSKFVYDKELGRIKSDEAVITVNSFNEENNAYLVFTPTWATRGGYAYEIMNEIENDWENTVVYTVSQAEIAKLDTKIYELFTDTDRIYVYKPDELKYMNTLAAKSIKEKNILPTRLSNRLFKNEEIIKLIKSSRMLNALNIYRFQLLAEDTFGKDIVELMPKYRELSKDYLLYITSDEDKVTIGERNLSSLANCITDEARLDRYGDIKLPDDDINDLTSLMSNMEIITHHKGEVQRNRGVSNKFFDDFIKIIEEEYIRLISKVNLFIDGNI